MGLSYSGIYLDNASTTSVLPNALERFNEVAKLDGNASSIHSHGRLMRKIVEESREQIAEIVGAKATEIIFTSSGTESDNFAIKGLYWHNSKLGKKTIITSSFEHHAVMDPAIWLQKSDEAKYLQVKINSDGYIDLRDLANMIQTQKDNIALISIIMANNEIGTIQPIAQVCEISDDIPVHTDCVQALGKLKIDFHKLGVTAASFTAHKVGGVPGVAAIYLKQETPITPLFHGGGQERELRSGTFNVPGIAAFAVALRETEKKREQINNQIFQLRERLFAGIKNIPGINFIGADDLTGSGNQNQHLPNILNCTFSNLESEALLMVLDNENLSLSAGSACTAGVFRPSHVLLSMGQSEELASASLRISLGNSTTQEQIDKLIQTLPKAVERARAAYASRYQK